MNRASCKLRMKRQVENDHGKEFENYRERAIKAEFALKLLIKGHANEATRRALVILDKISMETCGLCARPIPKNYAKIECRCDGTFVVTD